MKQAKKLCIDEMHMVETAPLVCSKKPEAIVLIKGTLKTPSNPEGVDLRIEADRITFLHKDEMIGYWDGEAIYVTDLERFLRVLPRNKFTRYFGEVELIVNDEVTP